LLRSLVAGKRILLVLDNAADENQVRPLLPGGGDCFVLVTSRRQLTGLVVADGAVPVPLGPLSPGEAHELLDRRLGDARLAADPDAAAALVAECAGVPLVLSIAAALALTQPHLPLAALATQLHARLHPDRTPSAA
jgi:hypothetical protein